MSTLQGVRCFAWAAAILGMGAPPLYADPTFAGSVEMVPGLPPSTRLGKQALAGRSPYELAFIAGRHLSWYREEHFVRLLVPSTPDLEDLFLAALSIANQAIPLSAEIKQRVAPLAKAIEPVLEPPPIDRVRGHFMRFIEEGGPDEPPPMGDGRPTVPRPARGFCSPTTSGRRTRSSSSKTRARPTPRWTTSFRSSRAIVTPTSESRLAWPSQAEESAVYTLFSFTRNPPACPCTSRSEIGVPTASPTRPRRARAQGPRIPEDQSAGLVPAHRRQQAALRGGGAPHAARRKAPRREARAAAGTHEQRYVPAVDAPLRQHGAAGVSALVLPGDGGPPEAEETVKHAAARDD